MSDKHLCPGSEVVMGTVVWELLHKELYDKFNNVIEFDGNLGKSC